MDIGSEGTGGTRTRTPTTFHKFLYKLSLFRLHNLPFSTCADARLAASPPNLWMLPAYLRGPNKSNC